jgi:hypothetical protein
LLAIPDNAEFVRACYAEILQRAPDAGGHEFFLAAVREGGMPRRSVIDAMLGGAEYRALQERE